MKFIICNSTCDYGFSSKLDVEYFQLLSRFFKIKRVNQKRYDTIISIKNLSDIIKIVQITKHWVILKDCLNPFLGISLPVLHVYDDWIE